MKTMKLTLLMAILALAFCRAAAAQDDYKELLEEAMKSGQYSRNQPENWDARLKWISGELFVKAPGAGVWSKIEGDIPVDRGDSIKTGSSGTAELYLDDKGSMSVGRNTELEVHSLDQTDSIFALKFGSIAAKIQHFLNEKFKMQVRTPSAVCAIRGTEFAVEYSQLGKETGVAVYDEGKVAVSALDEAGESEQEYILEKNTELTFKPSQRHLRPTPLARMARYRAGITLMRQRMPALKKTWRPVSPAKRRELRDKALKRRLVYRRITKLKPKAARQGRAVKAGARRKPAGRRPARDREAE